MAIFSNYATQFAKVLALAKENKTIVYHPCAVGLEVFGNDPKQVGNAFLKTAQMFQAECKTLGLSNVKVQFEVFRGADQNALTVAANISKLEKMRSNAVAPLADCLQFLIGQRLHVKPLYKFGFQLLDEKLY